MEEEFYYWMNVVMAIVPGMDYPMMAELLPWSMKQMGCDEWLPVLEAAIKETRIAETEPDSIPDGCFAVYCGLTESMEENSGKVRLTFFDEDWKECGTTWPDARANSILYIMQAGNYQVMLTVFDETNENPTSWVMSGDGWACLSDGGVLPEDTLLFFEEGDVYELATGGLP